MPAVFHNDRAIIEVGGDWLEQLKKAATEAPLRRARLCLHLAPSDKVQEMVIAFCRNSYVRPHRHLDKSESFHVIEGELAVVLFDDRGEVTRQIHMGPPGSGLPFLYRLSSSEWHSVVPLSDFVVMHETTNGPFVKKEAAFANWSPDDQDADGIKKFLSRIPLPKTARTAAGGELDITVVVTCYNEADYIVDTLENVVDALEEAGLTYEVIVIDDASKDDSVARIRAYLQQHPQYPVRLQANPKNRGLANNYVEGAFLGRGKYYRLVCGDNAVPKESLVDAFSHTGKADIIVTYEIQGEIAGKSSFRKTVSRTFTCLVNFISGYHLKYYNGLPTHLRYNVMRWHPISYGFGFQADLLTMLLEQGASYLQVHLQGGTDRKAGSSTALSMRNFLSVCHTLLEIAIRRFRRFLYGKDLPKPVEIRLEDLENKPTAR